MRAREGEESVWEIEDIENDIGERIERENLSTTCERERMGERESDREKEKKGGLKFIASTYVCMYSYPNM